MLYFNVATKIHSFSETTKCSFVCFRLKSILFPLCDALFHCVAGREYIKFVKCTAKFAVRIEFSATIEPYPIEKLVFRLLVHIKRFLIFFDVS